MTFDEYNKAVKKINDKYDRDSRNMIILMANLAGAALACLFYLLTL